MNPDDTKILCALPANWQQLWGDPLTIRCARCGERQTFDDLGAITAALLRPCRSCFGERVDAFDTEGNQVSVRCGNHGSAIGVLACRCVVNFFLKDGDIGSALYIPKTDAPVTCASCKVERQATGSMDLDHIALICLFCLLAIIRKAQRCGIPIFVLDDDGARLRWTNAGDSDGTTLIESKETEKIDVREVVDVHGVIPDEPSEPFDFHTVYSIVETIYCPGHGTLVVTLHQSRTVNDPPGKGELCGPKRSLRICVGSLPGLDHAIQGIKQELAGQIDETETKGTN